MSRLGEFINRLSTCPECRCGLEGGWRKECGCTRYDCECSETAGPDTDGEDLFDYRRPDRPAEPAQGKWWLGGRCSLSCGDVECPPCQREELHKADQLPPAAFPWLDGPPPEPPVGTVLETGDDIDTYRIERLPEGWAIQYRDGEDEFGLTHTRGRISWRAAWSAWGPPAGSRPFSAVPVGTPPLPRRPPEAHRYVGMSGDASNGYLDPPPAAQPYRATSTAPPSSKGPSVSTDVSYSGLQGRVLSIQSGITDDTGVLQQAIGALDERIAEVQSVGDASDKLQGVLTALMQAKQQCDEALGMLDQADQEAGAAAAGLA